MRHPVRLILALHNHQPVGNFDHVFEQAYVDSYRPFLDVFARYPNLKIALHTSGSLMEWLDQRHPEYVDQLAELVRLGRIEILGGPFYEPILAMIPSRDRIGQITAYRRWLKERLGADVRGMWVPERVWESGFTADVVDAGIEYTVLDDFHFKCAGVEDERLFGYMVTEDEGRVLSVFPGSERLRYLIPFADPKATIDYLAELSHRHHDAVAVFGDDGEKFGTWPNTKKHVYEDGWLVRFFDALSAQADWLHTTTFGETIDQVPPAGKVYIPDCSYREMTEWALPAQRLVEYETLSHQMHDDPRWQSLRRFVRGGFWRNFRVKYPEADEMYARMMMVSRRLHDTWESGAVDRNLEQAQRSLYRAQCNCGWWHGAFGGIYLPHLRNAIYHHLITADNLIDRAAGKNGPWVDAAADDYNFDGRQEVCLSNDKLLALIAPSMGGQLTELDVRSIGHNLGASFTRQAEAYHAKVRQGERQDHGACASIHDRVVFKQAGLDQRLQYDAYRRKSLIDLFFDADATLDAVARGAAPQRGDFVGGAYEARVRRKPQRIQVQLSRDGSAGGVPLRISKAITLDAGSPMIEVAYLLENLPPNHPLHFACEWNFAGLPAGADDRFFTGADGGRLGQLGARLDLDDQTQLSLTDQWLGISVVMQCSRPTRFWTFPIETVSQSEGGFELVHQSTAVLPHWIVTADHQGRWGVSFTIRLDTSAAENRHSPEAAAAAVC